MNRSSYSFVTVLLALALIGCGGEAPATQKENRAQVVSFAAPQDTITNTSVDFVISVSNSDGSKTPLFYDIWIPGVAHLTMNSPPGLNLARITDLTSNTGYTSIIKVWSKKPDNVEQTPEDDIAYTTFRTLQAPKEEPVVTPLIVSDFKVNPFGSAQGQATFVSSKIGYATLQAFVSGRGWVWVSSTNIDVANSPTEMFFNTAPLQTYQLRLQVTAMRLEQAEDTFISAPISYTSPAPELVIDDPAYGNDVNYVDWRPALDEALLTRVEDLRVRCDDYEWSDPYQSNERGYPTDVYENQVFFYFFSYETFTTRTRCFLTGRDRVNYHRLRSNALPMVKFDTSALYVKEVAVNATSAQFSLTSLNNTLTNPTLYCNTVEESTYQYYPFVEFWQRSTQVEGVAMVRDLLPGRQHYCVLFAVDARTGVNIVVQPRRISTRPANEISFGTTSEPFFNGYVQTTFDWRSVSEASRVRISCACDRPGNPPGCNPIIDESVTGQIGKTDPAMLLSGAYYTCVGSVLSSTGEQLVAGGEYSFLAVPDIAY